MAYEARPNSGSVFPNDKKEKPSHPDFRGDIVLSSDLVAELAKLVNSGKPAKFRIAGWKKESSKGMKYLSLQASSADFKASNGKATPKQSSFNTDDDPF